MIQSRNRKGYTLVEIMIVVAIIGLLAAIAIPSFAQVRTTSRQSACINNLRHIASAKDQWAIENNVGQNLTPGFAALDAYLRGGTANVVCPQDPANGGNGSFLTSYNAGINPVNVDPTCAIDSANHVL